MCILYDQLPWPKLECGPGEKHDPGKDPPQNNCGIKDSSLYGITCLTD